MLPRTAFKFVVASVLGCHVLSPLAAEVPSTAALPPVRLLEGLGTARHPVSTSDPTAQQFFDQGLALLFAFDHAEAARSFRRAAELDEKLAMAAWGEAMAEMPDVYAPAVAGSGQAAVEAIRRAERLAHAPDSTATRRERAYVAVLATRFSPDAKASPRQLAARFAEAMWSLSIENPDDLDAATLFAGAVIALNGNRMWTADGRPERGTPQVVAVLENVLRRDPAHVGANHFYIHVVEASPQPWRALESARRLPQLAPAAGHLLHMPAHIYLRTGDYAAAVSACQASLSTDNQARVCGAPESAYWATLYHHNIHFLALAACMTGQSKLALSAADQLAASSASAVKTFPVIESLGQMPWLARVRFRRWDEILAAPPPRETMRATTAAWLFACGMANAARGELDAADRQRARLDQQVAALAGESGLLNGAADSLPIAQHLLAGRIAGRRGDRERALRELRAAVAVQDSLGFGEPPAWPWPVREALGAELLSGGNASEAQAVFEEDLRRYPNNPRSLLGLAAALKAQRRDDEATAAETKFREHGKAADFVLHLDDLW